MAFWWVMQGQTYGPSSAGGFLWAPGPDAKKKPDWVAMDSVLPGDIVFSYVNGFIVAVAVPTTVAYRAERPVGYPAKPWGSGFGRKIDATYQRLTKPIALKAFGESLRRRLTLNGGPLKNPNLDGKQGYLYPIVSYVDAHDILALMDPSDSAQVDDTIASAPESPTEREAITLARVGHGAYRDRLRALWHGCCAVSQLTNPKLLRASHIKPWRYSNNVEKLDEYNGLFLAVNYDAAFDRGLISFRADGRIVLSPTFSKDEARLVGISESDQLTSIAEPHRAYLEVHRGMHGF